MDYKLLKDLYCIHSKSGREEQMIRFIMGWIKKNVRETTIECDKTTGNIYITKGKSKTYPCIAAHMDQVQTFHPKDFKAVETPDIIFGYSPSQRKYCGLGADDKNGVWIGLMCLQRYPAMKCAFFVGEEVGCIGSGRANMDFFSDCRFVIEPDRRGNTDVINEISFSELCSDEFINAIRPKAYGYKATGGLMTDIECLKENGLDVSCINLSCGYYEPHTDHEYTVKADLMKCLRFIEHIIEDCTSVYSHVSTYEDKGFYGGHCTYGFFDDFYDEIYDVIYTELSNDSSLQPADIYEKYKHTYPGLSRDDVAMAFDDAKYSLKLFSNED